MKIIANIPNDIYKRILANPIDALIDRGSLVKAIQGGKIIPDDVRLIDANSLDRHLNDKKSGILNDESCPLSVAATVQYILDSEETFAEMEVMYDKNSPCD